MHAMRDTYVEIDLKALEHNLERFRDITGHIEIMAVIKANAYGHGAVTIRRRLAELGVNRFAVATLNEAAELRDSGTDGEILILGYTPEKYLTFVPDLNLTQTVYSLRQAEILSGLSRRAHIQIKIETGLNRIGFSTDEKSYDDIATISRLPYLSIDGIYSQYAGAGPELDDLQYKKFTAFIDECARRGMHFPMRHIADGIAAIDYPDRRLDMVRPGCFLYGFNARVQDLKPVMQFKSTVAYLHRVKAGEGIGYESETSVHDRLIATLPFGYVDGCPWSLSNHNGWVSIRGKRADFTGLLCMDMSMVDVTEIDGVRIGDEVLVFGNDGVAMTYPECAAITKRHRNELQSSIPARVPRVYLK